MDKKITAEMVESVSNFLQDDGKSYFLKELLAYGSLIHLHVIGGGMQVRNHLRQSNLCEGWSDHDYDNNWINVVMKAIAQDETDEEMFIQGVTPDNKLIL